MRKLLRLSLRAVVGTVLVGPPATTRALSTRIPIAIGRTRQVSRRASSSPARCLLLLSNNSNNPSFSSLIGDMAASLLGGSGKSPTDNPALDTQLQQMGPSWDSLPSQLESQQTESERQFRANLTKGYGVGSPLHKIRLFDESNKEEDIRVTFYRDSASWCPYCQKVWMSLEEKKIPYRVEKVNMRCYGDKPPEFSRMQPSGQIPVAIINGKVYGQSNDILAQLEDEVAFGAYKSLRPASDQEGRAQELLKLERQIFSAWMYWLTGGGEASKRSFLQTLDQVERALKQSPGPFFMGPQVTLVDFQYAPFLERMAASLLYYKGFQMRVAPGAPTDYPGVNRWFDAMETLPSYQLTKSDYYTHCWDLPPQLGGCVREAGGIPFERAINGESTLDGTRGSWELPLEPHSGGVEPDWTWANGDDDRAAQREAVERVSANFDAIVLFAARGAGRKGMPAVSAPLADPYAVPSIAVQASVSAILRIVCAALLDGSPEQSTMDQVAKMIVGDGGSEFASSVVDSLAYLRDRVGVPRDMKLPAARQLRAYLNWAIGSILDPIDCQ